MSPRSDLDAAWRRELRAGLEHLRAGRLSDALSAFERAHARAPERPEVCVALGRERMRAGRIGEAEELLRKAWTVDPTFASAAASLARCIGVLDGRHAEALAVLEDALHRHAGDPGLLVVRCEVLLEAGRVAEARADVETALRATQARRGSAARVAAEMALARVHNSEGLVLATAGEVDVALFSFKRASDLDPEWAAPVVNLGSAFFRLGRVARARSAWERALVLDPDNAAARRNLAHERVLGAEALLESNDLDGAERLLRTALAVSPTHTPALARLADVLGRQGHYLEAAATLRRARELDSDGEPAP